MACVLGLVGWSLHPVLAQHFYYRSTLKRKRLMELSIAICLNEYGLVLITSGQIGEELEREIQEPDRLTSAAPFTHDIRGLTSNAAITATL